jgi:hypothetical protein
LAKICNLVRALYTLKALTAGGFCASILNKWLDGGYMMEESSRTDIRRLLKTFGVQADEAMIAYLALHPQVDRLQVRLIMEDITDYGDELVTEPLHLAIEGEIRR